MPIAITTSPTYPVAGDTVTLTATGLSGTKSVFDIVATPSESEMDLGLVIRLSSGFTIPTSATDVAGLALEEDELVFDAAGQYAVTVYDMRDIAGVPEYPGDPKGESRVELLDNATVSVDIGGYTYLDIKTAGGQGGRLRLQINDETIRDADIVDTTDEPSRQSALQAPVVAALAALINNTVSGIDTDFQTGVNNLRDIHEVHRATVAVPPDIHLVADNTNVVTRTDATSNDGAIELLNEIYYALVAHLKDSTAAAAPWHINDDLENIPAAGPAETLAQATVLSADLRERCYERHRLMDGDIGEVDCHDNDDLVNVLAAPSLLDNLITAYLDELVSNAPATPAQEPKGLMDIRQKHGFRP